MSELYWDVVLIPAAVVTAIPAPPLMYIVWALTPIPQKRKHSAIVKDFFMMKFLTFFCA
jgi:hypothetical protein